MTKKIRVAIDGFRIVCERNTSGRAYAVELIAALSLRPEIEEIIVLVPWVDDAQLASLAHFPKISVQSANISKLLDPARSWFRKTYWIQWLIPGLISRKKIIFDWYIAPYHQCPLRLSKVKVLAVIHDLCGLRADCGYQKRSKGYWNHRFNFWTAIRRADVLVPISQFARRDFIANYPKAAGKIISEIYNSVKSHTLSVDAGLDALKSIQIDKPFFIAFSATGPRKGTDITLSAYKKYKAQGGKSDLVLIGGRAGIDFWKNSAEAKGLIGVHWLPHVTDLVRDALYQRSVALLFPSRCEGFGYPIVEALRQGCPSVALEYSPAKEILPDTLPLLKSLDYHELERLMWKYDSLASQRDATQISSLIQHSQRFADDTLGIKFVTAMITR
ncbi:glycosyltransferase [Aquabacterium soli]|uniref:Glycosyltransferase n=1 Tax=Aquabacterium soli TaxID=2493092 RepID=A0A426UZD1_9BURK|nr:glycosyltransferase [Aquabacterium soli]RRR99942.1 glycosyltransferase [Aquabacterium soli]